jgi:Tol biopolymer transport system component
VELCSDLKIAQRECYDFAEKTHKKLAEKSILRFPPFFKPWAAAAFLILTLLVVFASGYLLLEILVQPKLKQLSLIQSTRINNSGKAVRAALSPDGKYPAYAIEEKGRQGLFLQLREDNIDILPETKALIPPSEQKFSGLVFTPDEKQIYFTASELNKNVASLYRIATGGGEAQKVLENITGEATFSPDGKQIAFLRLSSGNSHKDILTANTDGTDERLLYTRRMPNYIPHLTHPAWSPDGQIIIVAAGTYNQSREEVVPLAIKVSDGGTATVFNAPWEEIWQIDWVPDGNGFIMTGREDKSYDNKQLWYVSYPDGRITRLTHDFNDYFGVSISGASSGQGLQLVSVI